MANNITNGWEFLNTINPHNMNNNTQNIQNEYMQNYNLAYHTFINSLCMSVEELENIKNINKNKFDKFDKQITKHRIIIDLDGDSDIINKNSEFNIKFQKSKFLSFKNRKIKTELIKYYKPLGFFVNGPNELINYANTNSTKYFVELFWNNV